MFSEGPNPVYVGQSQNLHQHLRQHAMPSSDQDSAPFAFNLALREARNQVLDITGTPREIAARTEFNVVFAEARRRIADMNIQVVEVDDPVTRTIFEVYAARILATDEFISSDDH